MDLLRVDKSFRIPDTFPKEQINNKENEINLENEFKNPYLKKNDVPIIIIINKNEIIYDGKLYKIDKY